MATVAVRPKSDLHVSPSLPGRRYDHFFFSGMAWLMFAVVIVGFGPTYYFAGVFHAPLPSMIIHVHGAAFTLWMLLLVRKRRSFRRGVWTSIGVWGWAGSCWRMPGGVGCARGD
jgi:hypothetical protein